MKNKPNLTNTKMLLLALICLLPAPTLTCHNGCLSCSDAGECLLCDTVNFFYLEEASGKCEQTFLANCIFSEEPGTCRFCESKYFWNPETGECESMSVLKKKPNCRSHDKDFNCLLCNEEYKLVSGQCVFDYLEIAHCLDFDAASSTCRACLPGFRLGVEGRTCIVNDAENCLVMRDFECSECSLNYFPRLIEYYSSLSTASLSMPTSILLNSISYEYSKKIFYNFISGLASDDEFTCEKTSLSHCQELKSKNECALCVEPYVLNSANGSCESPILPKVPFCLEYYGRGACSKCSENYYKKSNYECASSFQINFCVKYAQAYNGCVQCEEQYKLGSQGPENTCVQRSQYPIANCGKQFLFSQPN